MITIASWKNTGIKACPKQSAPRWQLLSKAQNFSLNSLKAWCPYLNGNSWTGSQGSFPMNMIRKKEAKIIGPKVSSRLTDKAFFLLPTQTSVRGKNNTRTLTANTHYGLNKKNKSAITIVTTCCRYGYTLANTVLRPPLNSLVWMYWIERAEEGGSSVNSGVNMLLTPVENLLMTMVLPPPTAKHFFEIKENKLIN